VTVFLQSQVLIDAISCFIGESKPGNVNEHFRALDCRVHKNGVLAHDHDRYFQMGELTMDLLFGMWSKAKDVMPTSKNFQKCDVSPASGNQAPVPQMGRQH
jgi:hypothetical protein